MSDIKSQAQQTLTEWQQSDRALIDGFQKSFWGGAAPIEARLLLAEVRSNNQAIVLNKILQMLAGEPAPASRPAQD